MAFGLGLVGIGFCRRYGPSAPPVPSAPVLSGGAITQDGPDLILTAPTASGYPVPTVTLVSLLRDAVDVTADLIGLTLPNFATGSYAANWSATNTEGSDTTAVSGSFTTPAIAPSFVSGPAISGTPATGETLTLSFTAAGTEPITADIQWLKNGVVIPGETGLTYLLGTVASLDVFRADAGLTNSAGTTGFIASNTLTAPDIGTIEGTPISILDYGVAGDDTLETVITRGSYTATVGAIIEPIPLEFSLDGGAWDEYPLSTVLTFPGEWSVREIVTSTSGATQTFTAGPMTVVGAPTATFPQIISYADTVNSNSGALTTDVTMPGTYAAGDILLAFVSIDGTGTRTIPADWTILANDLAITSYRRLILMKTAAGGDTLSIDHNGAGERSSAKCLALSAGSVVTLGAVETTEDASALTYASAADTLWLIYASHDGVSADIGTGLPPTDYTFLGSVAKSGTSTADTATHVAYRELNAASEDPGAFSLSPQNIRTQTIGVRF